MTPYAVETGDVPAEHVELYHRVLELVEELPDGLDCHGVCAAISAREPSLRHVRGFFLNRGYGHSWLMVGDSETLIDPYPWAGVLPFMLTLAGSLNPWRRVYFRADSLQPVCDI